MLISAQEGAQAEGWVGPATDLISLVGRQSGWDPAI